MTQSTYAEVVLGMGLRFIGIVSTIFDLAYLYSMAESLVKRCISMFFDVVDSNTDLAKYRPSSPIQQTSTHSITLPRDGP